MSSSKPRTVRVTRADDGSVRDSRITGEPQTVEDHEQPRTMNDDEEPRAFRDPFRRI